MPILSAFTAVAARALGLTNGAPPGPPTISGITQSSTSISFNITAVLGSFTIVRMEVQRDGGPWVQTNNLTSHTFNGLTSSTTYTFQVRAVDVAGQTGPPSALQTVTTSNEVPPTQPATVTLTQKSTTSDGSNAFKLDLSYTAATVGTLPITGYEYLITRNSDSAVIVNWTTLSTAPGATFIVTGLTPSTAYTASVRAFTSSGTRGNSRTATATTAAPKINSTPTVNFVRENLNSSQTAGSVTFTFGVSSGGSYPVVAYYYKLHTAPETISVPGPGTEIITPEYPATTSITISVRSLDSAGNYSSYGILPYTISQPLPGSSTLYFSSDWNVGVDKVPLNWTSATRATQYKLYRDGEEILTTSSLSTTTFSVTVGAQHSFYVVPYNGNVAGPQSNTVIIQLGNKNVPFTNENVIPSTAYRWYATRSANKAGCNIGNTFSATKGVGGTNDNVIGYANITNIRVRIEYYANNLVETKTQNRTTTLIGPGYSNDVQRNNGFSFIDADFPMNVPGGGTFSFIFAGDGWATTTSSGCALNSANSMQFYDFQFSGTQTTGNTRIQGSVR